MKVSLLNVKDLHVLNLSLLGKCRWQTLIYGGFCTLVRGVGLWGMVLLLFHCKEVSFRPSIGIYLGGRISLWWDLG